MVGSEVGNIRGSALLELAMTLPVLLLLVAAIFTLGRLIWQYQLLTDAAKYAARVAAIDSEETALTCDQLTGLAKAHVAAYLAENDKWGLTQYWDIENVNANVNIKGEYDTASYDSVHRKGLRVKMMQVEIKLKEGMDNCFFCYGSFLRRIALSTSSSYDLHFASSCMDDWS